MNAGLRRAIRPGWSSAAGCFASLAPLRYGPTRAEKIKHLE
jgi:hypothetical protein